MGSIGHGISFTRKREKPRPLGRGGCQLLSFYATVERIGTTSVTVHVEVYAERNPADPKTVKVTEANLTYVAIDRDGRPRPIVKAPAPAPAPLTGA